MKPVSKWKSHRLLSREQEEILKPQLTRLWNKGFTASKIAAELQFGKEPFQNLEKKHVYHYVWKWGLPTHPKQISQNINLERKHKYPCG